MINHWYATGWVQQNHEIADFLCTCFTHHLFWKMTTGQPVQVEVVEEVRGRGAGMNIRMSGWNKIGIFNGIHICKCWIFCWIFYYPLVIGKWPIYRWFTYYKLWFSMAMLNKQMVYIYIFFMITKLVLETRMVGMYTFPGPQNGKGTLEPWNLLLDCKAGWIQIWFHAHIDAQVWKRL